MNSRPKCLLHNTEFEYQVYANQNNAMVCPRCNTKQKLYKITFDQVENALLHHQQKLIQQTQRIRTTVRDTLFDICSTVDAIRQFWKHQIKNFQSIANSSQFSNASQVFKNDPKQTLSKHIHAIKTPDTQFLLNQSPLEQVLDQIRHFVSQKYKFVQLYYQACQQFHVLMRQKQYREHSKCIRQNPFDYEKYLGRANYLDSPQLGHIPNRTQMIMLDYQLSFLLNPSINTRVKSILANYQINKKCAFEQLKKVKQHFGQNERILVVNTLRMTPFLTQQIDQFCKGLQKEQVEFRQKLVSIQMNNGFNFGW